MGKLRGKIFWLLGDLRVEEGEYVKVQPQIAKLTDVFIDDSMISFGWQASRDFEGGFLRVLNDHGSNYSGSATIVDYSKNSIEVRCELFENKKGFMLKGTWIEDKCFYTWWAEIKK